MKGFTTNEFIEHLANKAPDWELVGEYTNAITRTEFRHKPCGNITLKTPYVVTSKPEMCRFCNAKNLSGREQFFERAKKKTSYEVLGEYKNNRTKIKVRHKVCGREFMTNAGNFIVAKEGCPYCVGNTISKTRTWTHEQFIERIGERADEYEFLDRYVDAKTPLRVRHICGNEFSVTPDSFLRGSRCKSCKYSTGEGQVYRLVKRLLPDEQVIQDDRTLLPNRAEIDIYIPSRKLGIEYDGLAYHTYEHFMADNNRKWTKTESKNRHKWKTDECLKKGVRLIHIFEDEWLEHPEIVEDKLRAILKLPMKRYFARKLEIKIVPKADTKDFLNTNHIQGSTGTTISVGLYDGDRLVAVQSFVKYTRSKDYDGAWELVRYTTLLGTQVVGGFSRCLKWFEREYQPKSVVSFADKRWCDQSSNVYESSGFKVVGEVPPNYWYVKPPKRYHKFKFRKAGFKSQYPKVYSPDKTESQMAKEVGLRRIYDCGLVKYQKITLISNGLL